MAVTKTILRKVHQEAIIKVAGTPTDTPSATISLADDLVAAGQALDGEEQSVNITGVTWTGSLGSTITISRNNVVIMTLQANAAGALDFGGQNMIPDSINSTSDIVVTVGTGQAECWLKLRKVSGYKTTVEPEQFGPYDNPAVAGE
jgi:hypothetical protein